MRSHIINLATKTSVTTLANNEGAFLYTIVIQTSQNMIFNAEICEAWSLAKVLLLSF